MSWRWQLGFSGRNGWHRSAAMLAVATQGLLIHVFGLGLGSCSCVPGRRDVAVRQEHQGFSGKSCKSLAFEQGLASALIANQLHVNPPASLPVSQSAGKSRKTLGTGALFVSTPESPRMIRHTEAVPGLPARAARNGDRLRAVGESGKSRRGRRGLSEPSSSCPVPGTMTQSASCSAMSLSVSSTVGAGLEGHPLVASNSGTADSKPTGGGLAGRLAPGPASGLAGGLASKPAAGVAPVTGRLADRLAPAAGGPKAVLWRSRRGGRCCDAGTPELELQAGLALEDARNLHSSAGCGWSPCFAW